MKRRKKVTDPQKLEQTQFWAQIRNIFIRMGFVHLNTREKNMTLNGNPSDVDALFIMDNLILTCEDTIGNADKSEHIRKANDWARIINENQDEFISEIKRITNSDPFEKYRNKQLRIIHLYCSKNKIESDVKIRFGNLVYLSEHDIRYFDYLTRRIKKSARFEMLRFLDIKIEDMHPFDSAITNREYRSVRWEALGNTVIKFEMVSFMISPQDIIEQGYILRKEGWSSQAYQRMLLKNKLQSIRKYVATTNSTFANNIIATLPRETSISEIRDEKGNNIPCLAKISIPYRYNSICIIDGQHRVFAYHEDDNDPYENKIKDLRKERQLLLTGIIFPDEITDAKRIKFEAKLFLDINDKQTKVEPRLIQELEVVLDPFSKLAIAKRVVDNLNEREPFKDALAVYWYDKEKIKVASIVGYGNLRDLISISKKELDKKNLFDYWEPEGEEKEKLLNGAGSISDLDLYTEYCAKCVSIYFSAIKEVFDDMWTADKKKSRLLTTISINGFIYALMKHVEKYGICDFKTYRRDLSNIPNVIPFSKEKFEYTGSQWVKLGIRIFEEMERNH